MTTLYIAHPADDTHPVVVHRATAGTELRSACGVVLDEFVPYVPLGHSERYCARCIPDGVIAR